MSENSIKSESHIDAIVRQEEEALERRSSSERLADGVGAFAGSLVFVVLHLVFLIGRLRVTGAGFLPSSVGTYFAGLIVLPLSRSQLGNTSGSARTLTRGSHAG